MTHYPVDIPEHIRNIVLLTFLEKGHVEAFRRGSGGTYVDRPVRQHGRYLGAGDFDPLSWGAANCGDMVVRIAHPPMDSAGARAHDPARDSKGKRVRWL
jgi:hypothetical protein